VASWSCGRTSAKERSSSDLPNSRDTVRVKRRIAANERDLFGQRLCGREAIERVLVMVWQRKQPARVAKFDREDADVVVQHSNDRVAE
jgi:hypothetical protein